MAREHFDSLDVLNLAQEIMVADAQDFGHQFPAYRDDPIAETLRAIDGIVADANFAERYATFLRDMVYGEKPEFKEAVGTVVGFSEQLKSSTKS